MVRNAYIISKAYNIHSHHKNQAIYELVNAMSKRSEDKVLRYFGQSKKENNRIQGSVQGIKRHSNEVKIGQVMNEMIKIC